MLLVLILFIVFLAGLASAVFLLGFKLGGEHWQSRLTAVRFEAIQAERRLHDLTRNAFVAMAEELEKRRQIPGR